MLKEIKEFLHKDLAELSPEAIVIIEKVYRNEDLSEQEQNMSISASESAALLSAKYHRPVSRKYVKELAREFVSKDTGRVTPARIKHVRTIGTSHLYKTGDVLAVRMVKPRKTKPKEQIS